MLLVGAAGCQRQPECLGQPGVVDGVIPYERSQPVRAESGDILQRRSGVVPAAHAPETRRFGFGWCRRRRTLARNALRTSLSACARSN